MIIQIKIESSKYYYSCQSMIISLAVIKIIKSIRIKMSQDKIMNKIDLDERYSAL